MKSKFQWQYPRRIAHRGAGRLAPENTLAAMRLGVAHGYRMVEFDVKLSGDGTAFLLHDATLDRTTNGRGRADALTWAELTRLDAGSWHSPAYAGETLPSLAAISAYCVANSVACNIEIKPNSGTERETGAAIALEAFSLWRHAPVPPLLSSFSPIALEAARAAVVELPRALLMDEPCVDWAARLEELQCVAVNVNFKHLNSQMVEAAHAAGYKVLAYTPNEPDDVTRVAGYGVDAIITDAIDTVVPV